MSSSTTSIATMSSLMPASALATRKMKLTGWGHFPQQNCQVSVPRSEADLRVCIARGSLIARGNGRAYGDSAFNATNTVDMRGFNRMLAFNHETGRLTVEAGVLLGDVIAAFLPRGWFPPVTPGTKFVTIGGMIAADVHGKNHHKQGSFGAFVDWIDVMASDGTVARCSSEANPELFEWTIGGMGLTGVILRAAFRLRPVETGWIRRTLQPAPDLDAAMAAFEASNDATYSVAWIDSLSRGAALGRSLIMLGEHLTREELTLGQRADPYETTHKRKLAVPFDVPFFALNRFTMQTFNALYYRTGVTSAGASIVDWDSYFYPLDSVLSWNRLYGRSGFAQFQCVLPLERSREGLQALLNTVAEESQGSMLAVLKRFGAQESRFSFPMLGYTLALDFPINRSTLMLMKHLDRITLDHGGRFYLAKDSRMSAETLRQSDARIDAFLAMRLEENRHTTFSSAQSERLKL